MTNSGLFSDSSAWENTWANISRLKISIKASKSNQIGSSLIRLRAKKIVQEYFRILRQELVSLELDVFSLDDVMQKLLQLSNSRAAKTSYVKLLRLLSDVRQEVEVVRERKLGEARHTAANPGFQLLQIEQRIIDTLQRFSPTVAISYQQVLFDLSDKNRISFRGTASELREILREVLDQLAPDREVIKSDGFKVEVGKTEPTMKQKVRYVLRSRGLGKTAIEAPENIASMIEDHKASLVRATYERGSRATHTTADRNEAELLKQYVETILCELLEIHLH